MTALFSLWLPILLSAVVVFIISSLVHMVIKWHAGDYGNVANEDAVRAAINAGHLAPGRYVIPHCKDMKEMSSPEMVKKYQEGPVMHFTVLAPGVPNMGKYLGQWFVWSLVVSTVAACITVRLYGLAHVPVLGAAKLIFAITLIAHGFGTVTESIWTGRPWSSSIKYLLDALLYALGAAAIFYWLWPRS
ncbi:MAG TPA: hypothetical protein VFJ90_15860 [Candidatus Didemnitutus sp.]|nr:hypothetical protein [Candidatus Didemnitutus sp.]